MISTLDKTKIDRKAARDMGRIPVAALLLKNLLWVIFSLAVAVVSLELVFACGHLGEECFLQLEPKLGFGHIPDKLITWRAEGYSRSVFETDGKRQPKRSQLLSNTRRIVFLGDSVVEAVQVPAEKTFAALTERLLDRKSRMSCQVFNYGVSAYGTLQQYLQYKEKIQNLDPDTVVVFYHQGDNNDNVFLEGVNNFYPRPYCKIDELGNLAFDWNFYDEYMDGPQAKSFHVLDYFRRHSRIFGTFSKIDLQLASDPLYQHCKTAIGKLFVLQDKAKRWYLKKTNQVVLQENPVKAPDTAAKEARIILSKDKLQLLRKILGQSNTFGLQKPTAWQVELRTCDERMLLTAGIFSRFAEDCRKNGNRLIVAALPAPPENQVFQRELNFLQRLASSPAGGFEYIDLDKKFKQLKDKQRDMAYFVYGDHLKAKGHEMVADILYKSIWARENMATMTNLKGEDK